ncbi:Dynamin-1-like protein [Auxenochlorella protothecoides]|uniref:Dynamin-1-like protein n=1 Tax=Auxenochlorella protothecoides TaxID=3075 RepID=A0A087SPR6_AUXPR|nr:Dynamin-1-like protein [Auxenochlorella protothecoides]KFM27720.1 Dynamin-1-like protein [Auxenochlorella protothecoides]
MARAFAEHEANLPVGDTLGQTLIPVINKLQDVFAQVSPDVRLDLPQVAVIGSQSSGKSSVLEALVGRDFLPRGSNIVTRRPLILQLIKIPPSPAGPAGDWGEFLHCHGKRFHDFDRIRQEILAETDRLVGTNKGVSDKPIRLKIYSSSVLTMTLVDLPGITRVPVGDQPNDIEARVRAMVLDYIAAESCIILAVTPANQDPAASDALELARRADPAGARTIGVLTKLDLMDRGTDAVAALRNEVVPLRLGHVGVVLRSQEDIASRRGMAEARAAERAFFEARPTLDGGSDALPTDELAGGARLRHVFREVLGPGLDALDPTAELSDADVRTAIRNSGGVRGALLIPEAPFELLTRRAVERLLAPCLQCKEYVHAELLRAAAAAAPPDVARFPALRAVLAEAVEAYVEQGAAPAEAMIRNLVACELAFINTSHPDFIGGNRAIAQGGGLARPPATLRVPAAMSDQEAVQVDVTRLLVASYFNIVRRNMQDLVPKALMLFLVNNLQRGLQQHLIHTLYREELFEELMTEREDVAAKRSGCLSALRALRAALVTLEGLPGEMAGRAAASGRWSFKAMLAEIPTSGYQPLFQCQVLPAILWPGHCSQP